MNSIEKNNSVDSPQLEKLPVEKIIDLVRQIRNDLIKGFLSGDNIQDWFVRHYEKPISKIKKEFLARDLQELLIMPVDLAHYASLIKEIMETNTANISKGNEGLFYQEIEKIFEKYKY
ncbi:MAG TPA: hypothetical protein VL443_02205 [Cyclobacteriaceae bacterium]|jgi:hypothetical protein|nr:hypothetical protein [Cyclobacteriaceae bacterium]